MQLCCLVGQNLKRFSKAVRTCIIQVSSFITIYYGGGGARQYWENPPPQIFDENI